MMPLEQGTQSTSVFEALITNQLAPIKYFGGGNGAGLMENSPAQCCELPTVAGQLAFP